MLTREQILEAATNGKSSQCLDGRDFARLGQFFEADQLPTLGLEVREGVEWKPIPFTKANVLEQLKGDVAFGFEKALDQRGISASFMHETILMWMWVLEDELQHSGEYAQYGLPLLKKVSVKYGFPNEIGDDYGNESKYASEW